MNRTLFALVFVILFFSMPLYAAPQADAAHPVRFVELYTSDACSSCLAADAAFTRVAARKDVLSLEFHVAYWDYLGWKDRYAIDAAGQRQWDYAHRWHRGEVFTPEMIINGTISGIGNNAASIAMMLHETEPLPLLGVSVEKEQVVVSIPSLPHPAGEILWIATFDRDRNVQIGHGENAGQVIHEVNIVRFAVPFSVLTTTPATIPVPAATFEPRDGIVCFVQEPGGGPIVAAGRMFVGGH